MIVDTHVHVISEDQRKYPRKTGKLPEWVQDMTGEMLIALNREAGIGKTVLVQGFGPYADDNNYAADCGVVSHLEGADNRSSGICRPQP